MQNAKRAYLTYEIFKREFGSILFLAVNLALHGYKVTIGHQQDFMNSLQQLQPGVFWIKSVKKTYLSWVTQIKKFGHSIIAQDVEGIFINKNIYIKKFVCRQVLEKTDFFLVARNDIYLEIKKQNIKSNKLFKHEQLKNIYFRHIKKPPNRKNTIVIGTEFPFGNHHLGCKKMFSIFKGFYTKNDLLKKTKSDLQCVPKYLLMIKKVCLCNPKIQFKVRPHPSESLEYYKNNLSKINNCIVDNSNPIEHDLEHARGLITLRSTISFDAALLEIPALIPWNPPFCQASRLLYSDKSPDSYGKKTKTPEKLQFNKPKKIKVNKSIKTLIAIFDHASKRIDVSKKIRTKTYAKLISFTNRFLFFLKSLRNSSYFRQKYKTLSKRDVVLFLKKIKLQKKITQLKVKENSPFLEIEKNSSY